MKSFLTLFHRYILRDLWGNPARTVLTLTGVALGIAVVVGVRLANDRAIGSFNESLALLAGGADLQISANGLDLDESLVGELSWVWDVGAMTGVIEGRVLLDPSSRSLGNDPVRLLGIDLLSDAPFRTYVRTEGSELGLDVERGAFLDLLIEPDAVVIPGRLAGDLAVEVGDTVRFLIANRPSEFTVRAILRDTGVAAAFDGRIVFMDIAAAQWALGRLGSIDRIEIQLDPGVDVETVAERIRVQLPPSVIVYTPEDSVAETSKITRAFRYNLTALSYIALVVGVILIYNTLNIAVVRRRGEIGTLRTMGATRETIRRMFLIEAVGFGVVGAVLGVWAGGFLAAGAGALVSRTISMLYTGVFVQDGSGGIDWMLYLEMILLGGVLAGVSGVGPALRATRVPPAETLGRRGIEAPARIWPVAGIVAILFGIGLAFAPPLGEFPFLGYAAGVAFIAGFGLLSPLLVHGLVRLAGGGVRRLFPAEGRLALQTIEGSLGRIAVAVVSLSIAVAMLISVAIMVASFRDTVVVWIDQTLEGDLYVRPAASGGDGGRNVLASETFPALAEIPGIEATDRFRAIGIDYGGFPAILAGAEFETVAAYSRLLFMGGVSTREVADRLIGANRVVVSEPFAVRHDVQPGDTLMLPAPGGLLPFQVEAVFYDYSSEGGLIVMDRETYVSSFEDASVSNIALYLAPGIDPDRIRTEIAERTPDLGLRVATNGELRAQVLRVFDQTFEVTYALEVIALAVAMLGIANTLAALIIERGPELAMLRFVGAARVQIRRVVVLESALIGVLGGAIGLALGLVLSLLLIHVISFQSFGWTIQFALPVGFLVQSLVIVLVATILAGLYPASLALKTDPIKGIRAD